MEKVFGRRQEKCTERKGYLCQKKQLQPKTIAIEQMTTKKPIQMHCSYSRALPAGDTEKRIYTVPSSR